MAPWWTNARLASMSALLLACALAGCATTKGKTPPPPTERLPTIVAPDLDGRARGLDEFIGRVVLLYKELPEDERD